MCLGLKRLLWCPKDYMGSVYHKNGGRARPWWGENAEPSGFVTVCKESKCLFSKDYIIVCLFGSPSYYLFFVNDRKHYITCLVKSKLERNL